MLFLVLKDFRSPVSLQTFRNVCGEDTKKNRQKLSDARIFFRIFRTKMIQMQCGLWKEEFLNVLNKHAPQDK